MSEGRVSGEDARVGRHRGEHGRGWKLEREWVDLGGHEGRLDASLVHVAGQSGSSSRQGIVRLCLGLRIFALRRPFCAALGSRAEDARILVSASSVHGGRDHDRAWRSGRQTDARRARRQPLGRLMHITWRD